MNLLFSAFDWFHFENISWVLFLLKSWVIWNSLADFNWSEAVFHFSILLKVFDLFLRSCDIWHVIEKPIDIYTGRMLAFLWNFTTKLAWMSVVLITDYKGINCVKFFWDQFLLVFLAFGCKRVNSKNLHTHYANNSRITDLLQSTDYF